MRRTLVGNTRATSKKPCRPQYRRRKKKYKDGRRRHVVLGLRELVSKHSSKNIAAALVKLFKEYKIGGNISYFMADNAELYNKAIKAVL